MRPVTGRPAARGGFRAEFEVVPDRCSEWVSPSCPTPARHLFAEDVLGYTPSHKPRHVSHDLRAGHDPLRAKRVIAFQEPIANRDPGAYPEPEYVIPLRDAGFERSLAALGQPPVQALAAERAIE